MENILMNLWQNFYKSIIEYDRYKFLLEGLKNTVLISIFAILLGVVLGTIVAVIRTYTKESKKGRILSWACGAYVNIIRGTPIVLQLMIMYYVIFRTTRDMNLVFIGSLTFGINSGAYVSEIIRAGLESIDRGQMEAGRSLGLSYYKTVRLIILPQAIKNILPAIGNEFVTLIKETSVAGYIGIRDLTKASDIIASRTFDYFFPLIIVAIIYLILVLGLTQVLKIFERKLAEK